MQNIVFVGIGKCLNDLASEVKSHFFGKRTIFCDIAKEIAFGVLWKKYDSIEYGVCYFSDIGMWVIDGLDDVRMVELGKDGFFSLIVVEFFEREHLSDERLVTEFDAINAALC